MLGSHPISAVLGADITATSDTASIRAYLKGLTDAGLYVLLCKPGTKEPADYRTAKQIKDDDEAFQMDFRHTVQARGGVVDDAVTAEMKAPGGVHLATNDLTRLRGYVNRFRKKLGDGTPDEDGNPTPVAPVTLAISVGPSNLLVVDTDTAAQRQAFCEWMAELSGNPLMAFTLPTVLSPGVMRDGEWVHKDGGHFYFDLGDISLPASIGKLSITHNGETFDIFWRDRYILIPPSERAEGKYERLGAVMALRDNLWLVKVICDHAENRERKRADESNSLDPETQEALIDWYAKTPWSQLLTPIGWELTGTDPTCGCDTWGRPGRSQNKSATTHNVGCQKNEYGGSQDPPIHFWTTMPGRDIQNKIDEVGSHTLSKLQLYAALEFGGDDGDALRSIPELPQRRRVSVILPEGLPFGMSTDTVTYVLDHDEMDFDDEPPASIAAVLAESLDTLSGTLAYGQGGVGQPTLPQTAQQPAIYPATDAPPHAPVEHVGYPPNVQGVSSSENLVRPGTFEALAEQARLAKIATTPATVPATTPATGMATDPATVTSTSCNEPRYETTQTGTFWAAAAATGLTDTQLDAVANAVAAKVASVVAEAVMGEIRRMF